MNVLRQLATWWAQQMSDLLPRRLVAMLNRGSVLVISAGSEEGFRLIRRRGGHELELGQFDFDAKAPATTRIPRGRWRHAKKIVLQTTDQGVLERPVTLPLAAEADVGGALRLELDQLMPFRIDQVFWNWTVTGKDPARGKLHLRLSLLPKEPLRKSLDGLLRIGLVPDFVEAPVRGGDMRRFAFAGPTIESGPSGRISTRAMVWTCTVLAILASATPFVRQSWTIHQTEARIRELRPLAGQAEALRYAILHPSPAGEVINADRQKTGDVLRILAVLTEAVPDHTYLRALGLNQRTARIDGLSTNSADLMAVLGSAPSVRDARFAAPVTRFEGDRDSFSIQLEVDP